MHMYISKYDVQIKFIYAFPSKIEANTFPHHHNINTLYVCMYDRIIEDFIQENIESIT